MLSQKRDQNQRAVLESVAKVLMTVGMYWLEQESNLKQIPSIYPENMVTILPGL